MDLSVPAPDYGAGSGACAPTALTPKQAKKFFEFFSKGTRRDVIVLGDLVPQPMHYVKSWGYKVLCTAVTGNCDLCQKAPTSDDVAVANLEFLAPAARREKDRRYHQCVAVFTCAMHDGYEKQAGRERQVGLKELLGGEPARGFRVEVVRETNQLHKLLPYSGRRSALVHSLPAAFDVLPWIRARFGLPQDPQCPLTFFPPFAIRDLAAEPAARPKPLALTASDVRTADEWAKIKAKQDELKEKIKGGAAAGGAATVAPPAPAPEGAAGEPELSEPDVIKMARDPKRYAPREKVAAGMVPPAERAVAAAEARLSEDGGDPELAKAVRRNEAVKRKAAEARGDDNAVSLGDEFDDIVIAKKGGAK